MIKLYLPVCVHSHFNHSCEVILEATAVCARLRNTGISMGYQSILFLGVNDCVNIMLHLVHDLVRIGVSPYYIHQCNLPMEMVHLFPC